MRPVVITNEMRGQGLAEETQVREVEVHQSFAEAVASIAANVPMEIQVERVEPVTANVTVPANITVVFTRRGRLAIANGVTVTINGPVISDREQIFDCTGTGAVVFGAASQIWLYPQWWGAAPAAAAGTNNAAFAAALEAADNTGIPIRVPSGTYDLSATLNHARVNLHGENMTTTILNNTADRCMQADGTNPGSGYYIREIKLIGGKFGYHTNGKQMTRNLFDRVYLDGGDSDDASPPTQGFGFYANSQLIETRWQECVFDQMAWFGGSAFNMNKVDQCRFNASGAIGGDKKVCYYNQNGMGTSSQFSIDNSIFEVGGIEVDAGSGTILNFAMTNCGFYDPGTQGDDAIDIVKANGVRLTNIMAEDFDIIASGTVTRSQLENIYCYRIAWNSQPLHGWGLTTQNVIQTYLHDESFIEHEGDFLGRSGVLRRHVTYRLPADSAPGDTWTRDIMIPSRSGRVIKAAWMWEANVTGDNTNYCTITVKTGGATVNSRAYTLGVDATAHSEERPTETERNFQAGWSVQIQKAVTNAGIQLPAGCVTIEFWDQGVL